MNRSRLVFLLPLLMFLIIGAFLAVGLGLNPRLLPSPLIGKPVPEFDLPTLEQPARRVGHQDLHGQVALVNIWASWCVSCRQEHPLLVELSERHGVTIFGINYKDARDEGLAYLRRGGNPYQWNAHDLDGRAGIEWGVYGTPETYVVDRQGRIRYKHVGPLTRERAEQEILPLIAELEEET
ncbi:MAG: DsbE family thiol:disulfide interchange protein [Ectothiorhodospiraceae bacterium]|nr:DsbE family thiol:disulfide interchange protein [Ectothiorhodospiraceae bacterium]